ncbi:hypothetical protein GQ597_04115 [Gilliamella sp. Pra-s65]|uniref:hypothetical protein n=1 Tax=unclassified Gilliamella TaxID=2685620 RepID=UPI001366704B|nr:MULTISPECIES: hypothetical protein [unclassified Gilliamella]MWN89896.1 hypothetical protein [Gilliamella sp. Pra-s65]MWP73068.1 hypothetical protein [Gilliamella sp. Pra-s52]
MENQKPDEEGSILFKEIGFFGIVLTALLYVSVYACEVITAFYFGFDVDLISLPMSVVIKDSVLILNVILLLLLVSSLYLFIKKEKIEIKIVEIFNKIKIAEIFNKKTTEKPNCKIFKIILGILILSMIFLGCYYCFFLQKENRYYFFFVITYLSIMFFVKKIVSSKKLIQLFYFLFIFFALWFMLVALLFYFFVLQDFKPKKSFKYNEQDYILLRNYDGNLVATKATIIQQEKCCFNDEILYLPKEILKEGLTFKKVNFIGNCDELTILKRRKFLNWNRFLVR